MTDIPNIKLTVICLIRYALPFSEFSISIILGQLANFKLDRLSLNVPTVNKLPKP